MFGRRTEFQKSKLKLNQQRKKKMVANLDVNNLKSKWEQQQRIDTDTCERKKRDNRCQQLENRNDQRQVAPIPTTGIVAELTLEYKWVAITNGQHESGNWDGA